MDVPKYLQVMWAYKWLLLVGLIIASIAGFFSAFSYVNGEVVSRADHTYSANATVLVRSSTQSFYQSEIPGQTVPVGETPPTQRDLSASTVIYAYVVSGTATRRAVENEIGALDEGDTITALRRTTQPSGDEQFPGRFTLPILEIIASASTPERAELIAATANEVFQEQVAAEQADRDIPESESVIFETLAEPEAVEDEAGNPALPVMVTAIGVFLLFVAFSFVLYNVRMNRAQRAPRSPRRGKSRNTGSPSAASTASVAFPPFEGAIDTREIERETVPAGKS